MTQARFQRGTRCPVCRRDSWLFRVGWQCAGCGWHEEGEGTKEDNVMATSPTPTGVPGYGKFPAPKCPRPGQR
jgi:ribosomal protein L37AE/L43A